MCDTWVAMSDVTLAGHVILAKNSDRPIFDCQPLVFYPRTEWPSQQTLQLEYVELPQVDVTYATLGSSPYWCWGYEEGINEHRVAIGNEAIYTKTFREAADAYRTERELGFGLLGMDLIRLALERSQSAAQAIEVIGALVERYGQFGSGVPTKSHTEGGYDNSFLVADPTEAWIVEAIGRRWVARRITSGSASISNQLSIRTVWDAGSSDVVDYALRKRWWPTETPRPFDVAHAYIDETVPRQLSHIRAMRSHQLLAEQSGRITPQWMMRIARDHYEETFLQGPYFDAADPDFLSLCMHVSPAGFTWGNTVTSCVAMLPQTSDEPPVFWWTPGPPCNGCYVPFFVHGSRLPAIVSQAGAVGKHVVSPHRAEVDTFNPHSYWWLFRRLTDLVKGDPIKALPGCYPTRNRLVRMRFDPLEQEFATEIPEVLRSYARSGDAQILNDFTDRCVRRVVATLQGVLKEVAEVGVEAVG
jgi:secernin